MSKLFDRTNKGELKGFVIENDILFKIRKASYRFFKQLVVPKVMRLNVLKMCHDTTGAYLGRHKTLTKLDNRFYWPYSYKETINS